MHHLTDRITHTTAFVTPVMEHWVEREIAQCVSNSSSSSSSSTDQLNSIRWGFWLLFFCGVVVLLFCYCFCLLFCSEMLQNLL